MKTGHSRGIALWRLVRLFLSEKWLTVGHVASAGMCYIAFGFSDGNWNAAVWCAIAALMSLLHYDHRQKGTTIKQEDIDKDKELAKAVETIREYVKRRDASPNPQAEPRGE